MFGRKKSTDAKPAEAAPEVAPLPPASVADAYQMWHLTAQSTEIPGPLSAGRAFGLREARLLGAVLTANPLASLRLCGVRFDPTMRQALLDGLACCGTLKVRPEVRPQNHPLLGM
jgi:hypothetical protein